MKTGGANHNGKPDFRVVEDRPKLELTAERITLLIRSALLDDATNVSEKLGALHAEITVMTTMMCGSRLRKTCGLTTKSRCRP